MTALACLRVLVSSPPVGATPAALAELVERVGGARLERGWAWPRRYSSIAPFSFMLADPSVQQLDASELTQLAGDLQQTLFGTEAAGEVSLMLFEGGREEVTRLAAANPSELKRMLQGEGGAPFHGRVQRITSSTLEEVQAAETAVDVAEPPARPSPVAHAAMPHVAFKPADPADVGFWGVYFLARQRFVGSAVNWPPSRPLGTPALSEADLAAGDLTQLERVALLDQSAADGYFFLALGFSTLVRPSARLPYLARLAELYGQRALKPALTIYQTPRSPPYGAIREISHTFKQNFSMINLNITDPDFDVTALPVGAVNSVTFAPSARTELENLAAITRFDSHAAAYRSRKIWQGVAGLKTPRELDLCRRLKISFLSGSAVAPLTARPLGQFLWPAEDLPHQRWPSE